MQREFRQRSNVWTASVEGSTDAEVDLAYRPQMTAGLAPLRLLAALGFLLSVGAHVASVGTWFKHGVARSPLSQNETTVD
jgi:hypothetical protein